MKCPNCQTDNPDAAAFCKKGGTRLEASQAAPPAKEKGWRAPFSSLAGTRSQVGGYSFTWMRSPSTLIS